MNLTLTPALTPKQQRERKRCAASAEYFIDTYCQIYDAETEQWIPFRLWDAQRDVLHTLTTERLVIILKARQLGQTWLVLAYILHKMLFHPAQSVLLFSRRETDAFTLLGPFRLKGMFKLLPAWLQGPVVTDSGGVWALANGSVAKAFPLTAGDGETATIAFLDEADLPDDAEQRQLQRSVAPTVERGQMILLSKVDKKKPDSLFKRIYRAAKAGLNGWKAIFLPWHVRPDRTPEWYTAEAATTVQNTGTLDDLWENYPATDAEALAEKTGDKRIPPAWLLQCYRECGALVRPPGTPALPGLVVYTPPRLGRAYVVGADPAEGNPTSDDSAATVLDRATGEEVATLVGKIEPTTFANYLAALAAWYNRAGVLPERNNHGHAVIAGLVGKALLLNGPDNKPGWLTTAAGKARLYDIAAEAFQQGDTLCHTFTTYTQLASVEGNTLRAPEGLHDDAAVGYVLALAARAVPRPAAARATGERPPLVGWR